MPAWGVVSSSCYSCDFQSRHFFDEVGKSIFKTFQRDRRPNGLASAAREAVGEQRLCTAKERACSCAGQVVRDLDLRLPNENWELGS